MKPRPLHPGTILDNEIRARSLTAYRVAIACGVRPLVIHEIIKQRRPISARTALLLEQALPGRTASNWLLLQADYDLDVTRSEIAQELSNVRIARNGKRRKDMQIGITFPNGLQKIIEVADGAAVPNNGERIHLSHQIDPESEGEGENLSGVYEVKDRAFQLHFSGKKTSYGWSMNLAST